MTVLDSLAEVPLLREQVVAPGERWIFSAGFNLASAARDTYRIDCEAEDLAYLSACGARVAVLSHQGSHRDATAQHLGFAAERLARILGQQVAYFPENASSEAVARAQRMSPGEIVVFGNTRHHQGEERADPDLARRFSALGTRAAIGGFSKAHRAHASNVGVLQHVPGCLAASVERELTALAPWCGKHPKRLSVAVLGGLKAEKSVIGLPLLAETYDVIIPGGAVLAALLVAAGFNVGATARGDRPDESARAAADVLKRLWGASIILPRTVVVASRGAEPERVSIRDGVPAGWAIVDFELATEALEALEALGAQGGRALVAGTPTYYTAGHRSASNDILHALTRPGVDAILLGGDTVAELPWAGPISGGGGSALYALGGAALPLIEALRRS